MNFEETLLNIIEKLANEQRPTALELEQLRLEARELSRAQQILNSLIVPGTNTVEVPALRVPGGDVVIDEGGIFIKNNQEAGLSFGDPTNTRNILFIVSDLSGFLSMTSNYITGGIKLQIKLADGSTAYIKFVEDAANRASLEMWQTYLAMKGGNGSSMFPTPTNPPNNSLVSQANIYIRNEKLIVQYNDAGTVRYKYLDLTGTGVTWVHTTSAP